MAKMTLSELQTFCRDYVDASKQAGVWAESKNNVIGLIDKIGKTITIDGSFQDKLPELNGDDLPLGKTIEEYFIDLTLPVNYDANGAKTMSPADPTVEQVTYNYTLGRKTIKTTQRYDNIERAALSAEDAGNMAAKIMERLTNSYSLYTYAIKKQLLGNMITKAIELDEGQGNLVNTIDIPADTNTSEAFITAVKKEVENASFASENTSLGKALIGAAPALTLYVKKGVMPVVEVEAMAGAFNKGDLAIPATIKVVDDFGNAAENVYAVLCDPRGVKLHRGYHTVRDQMNGEGDFVNFFDHSEHTGFISKNTFVKVFQH